jgi:hypothetical protein
MEENGGGGFKKKTLCISVRQTSFSRATTLPWYGTGRSGVVGYFGMGPPNVMAVRPWTPFPWHPE